MNDNNESFVPLLYGSLAVALGKTDDGTTHRWTFYVRGIDDKDLSSVISKVVFRLHPTCAQPTVEVTQFPFETTQSGWGEFPAAIDVVFKDEKQSSLTFQHALRLHHAGTNTPVTKPVVHEVYEEVVFRNPDVAFKENVEKLHSRECPTPHNPLGVHWKVFSDENELLQIKKAHEFVKKELEKSIKEFREVEISLNELVKQPQRGEEEEEEDEEEKEDNIKNNTSSTKTRTTRTSAETRGAKRIKMES